MPSNTDEPTKQHLLDLTPDDLAVALKEMGEPGYRAKQILQWVYERNASSWDEMTNLSKPLRERMAERFTIFSSEVVRRAASTDGTVKLLLRWPDGATSECVMIPTEKSKTACVSSQVGCPVGCRFCASGLDGLQRNLSTGQIIEQALYARREALAAGDRLSNIVFMGLGEPLANYDNVIGAVEIINADWGLGIGARKITISTVGLPKQIRKLAHEGYQVNLALSLHAPNDALRAELIPWAEKISIRELTSACAEYFQMTGREITLEYTLLAGTNDSEANARELSGFVKRLRCNVNLLRYNPVESLPYRRPSAEAAHAFQERLRALGVNAHIRKSRGKDIDAACGQLRRREMQEQGGISLPVVDG
ncbi:MAG TPA: 23S rRNA (adenine(2503)-C(2))-methyltransferase RlmN [Phycisphaerae bacterium]|nr:23S rRNA (adenine(2503)-C(2))-methyltransferase RlmN [Phycisphaerae bacterium]HRW55030.1 23S rRNA (adenine(2503)-C(2))-methyltransferase RlmN [Phycisphaerae bacterium]